MASRIAIALPINLSAFSQNPANRQYIKKKQLKSKTQWNGRINSFRTKKIIGVPCAFPNIRVCIKKSILLILFKNHI